MKAMFKKVLALVLAVMLTATVFTGCDLGFETGDQDTVAAIFEGEEIYMDEAKMYIYTAQLQMEEVYNFWVQYYYKTYKKFWDNTWDAALSQAMMNLYQTKVLLKVAGEKNIVLTDAEKQTVAETVRKFKEDHAAVINDAGATDEILNRFFTDNALANKVYLALSDDFDSTIDADTYLRKSVTGIQISSIAAKKAAEEEEPSEDEPSEEPSEDEPSDEPSSENEPSSESEEEEKWTTEEQAEHVKTASTDIFNRMANETIDEIVESYKDNELVTVTTLGKLTLSPSDKKSDDAAEYTGYRQYAWDMAEGEVKEWKSGATSTTAYVLRMDDSDDQEASETAIEAELQNRRSTRFQEVYKPYTEKYDEFHVYTKKVAAAKFKNAYTEDPTEETEESAEESSEESPEESSDESSESAE